MFKPPPDDSSAPPAKVRLISVLSKRMAELHLSTHKQLAELVGCHESTISRLFSEGGHEPRSGLLSALDRGLQFSFGHLEAVYNGQEPQPVTLPSLSFDQALFALRLRRYPSLAELAAALGGVGSLLTEKLWAGWESGRSVPGQEHLQTAARLLRLPPFERGWLFGLSGVPVDWGTLDEKTRRDLQAEVDAWTLGPAISIGQPFGLYLTVNPLGCALVNLSCDPQVLEAVRLSNPSVLETFAVTSSFIAPYLVTAPGYVESHRRVIAVLKGRLAPYLSRPEVTDRLMVLRSANPEFAPLWDRSTPSDAGLSAWDMPVSLLRNEVILEFHTFWSLYLPDQRIEIMRFVPLNREAIKFVQQRQSPKPLQP